jgi:hypothetical protein
MKKIAIIQPIINNYRIDFFKNLSKKTELDLYTYNKNDFAGLHGFSANEQTPYIKLRSITIGLYLFYDILPLINKNYKYVVIIGNVRHISAWLLLIIGRLSGMKIILWGHGISVPRYLSESKKLPFIRIFMYKLAYGAWFYTEVELQIYKKRIKKLVSVSLNNTISEVDEITRIGAYDEETIQRIKAKYKITTKYNLIICTRFEHPHRKANELLDVIRGIDSKEWGLIVIGDGRLKPDFSLVDNIYDFGGIYDREFKNELFLISDLYIQLGAIGLSVVEAFAYGLPIITLKRSNSTHHGVEYSYISNDINGFLCEDLDDVIDKIINFDKDILKKMGANAQSFVKENLSISKMANSALSILN